MGIPNAEKLPQTKDAKQVEVTISKGFWISKYETSWGDYSRIRNRGGIPYNDENVLIAHANVPMTSVKGPQATGFSKEIVKFMSKAKSPIPDGWTYRLPTEAEWEYACRAGSKTYF